MRLFLLLKYLPGHYRANNQPDFNVLFRAQVVQGERETGQCQNRNILSFQSYMGKALGAPKTITIVT